MCFSLDEGVYDFTPFAIGEPDQTENWTKALEQPDSGRHSFTNVIVYVLPGISIITVDVWIVTGMFKPQTIERQMR